LVAYQVEQTPDVLGIEAGFGPSGMGFGLEGAGMATTTQKAYEEGEADRKEMGELTQGMLVAIDSSNDMLAEVSGVGSHKALPFRESPPVTIVALVRLAAANRSRWRSMASYSLVLDVGRSYPSSTMNIAARL
jgi:hypothetical protein